MNDEHTPGPWRIEPTISPPEKYICADKPEGQVELARVYDWAEYTGGEGLSLPAEANARLMAAAPEMLRCLEWLRADIRKKIHPLHPNDDWLSPALREIESAISAATETLTTTGKEGE